MFINVDSVVFEKINYLIFSLYFDHIFVIFSSYLPHTYIRPFRAEILTAIFILFCTWLYNQHYCANLCTWTLMPCIIMSFLYHCLLLIIPQNIDNHSIRIPNSIFSSIVGFSFPLIFSFSPRRGEKHAVASLHVYVHTFTCCSVHVFLRLPFTHNQLPQLPL